MSNRVPRQNMRGANIKLPPEFNVNDYKICDEITDLEWWAYNIKIRRYLFLRLLWLNKSYKEQQLNKKSHDKWHRVYWNNFLKERKVMLQRDGVLSLLENIGCPPNIIGYLSNTLDCIWLKERNIGLRQLIFRDITKINEYFADKFKKNRKKMIKKRTR